MAVELNQGKVTYGQSRGGYVHWKYDKEGKNVVTLMGYDIDKIEIKFEYDVSGNTYECDDAKIISRGKFALIMNKIKQKVRSFKV